MLFLDSGDTSACLFHQTSEGQESADRDGVASAKKSSSITLCMYTSQTFPTTVFSQVAYCQNVHLHATPIHAENPDPPPTDGLAPNCLPYFFILS